VEFGGINEILLQSCSVDHGHDACTNLGRRKKRVLCLWVFVVVVSVVDHEAVRPDGSKIVLKLGSHSTQAIGVVETKVWSADKQPVALLAKI
jgi:hypothetical protein